MLETYLELLQTLIKLVATQIFIKSHPLEITPQIYHFQ